MESGSDCRELEDKFKSSRISSPAIESGRDYKPKALSMRRVKLDNKFQYIDNATAVEMDKQ